MSGIRTRLFGIGVLLVNLLIILSLVRSVYDIRKRGDIVSERRKELNLLESENVRLKKSLEEAQSPEYIERLARNKLGMAKPGDTIILFEKPDASGSARNQGDIRSNLQKWWGLFF